MSQLIVTVGPTGSGKSRLPEEVMTLLGIKGEAQKFLIDDLVENNEFYKNEVKKY
jgi:pantothenate kinase-related protein Tda10